MELAGADGAGSVEEAGKGSPEGEVEGGARLAQPASTDSRLAAIEHLMKPRRMVCLPAFKPASGGE